MKWYTLDLGNSYTRHHLITHTKSLSAAAAITKSTERKYSPRIQFYFINLQIFNGFEISLFKNP